MDCNAYAVMRHLAEIAASSAVISFSSAVISAGSAAMVPSFVEGGGFAFSLLNEHGL